MKISIDSTGNILGTGDVVGATEYTGAVPSDFEGTYALGKYTMVKGVITEVAKWVAPTPPKLPF